MGRNYADPSYGSKKAISFTQVTAGTRATALVESIKMAHPITVVGWNMDNTTLGTGGSSGWVLYKNGTTAIGTISWTGTHALGVTLVGTAVVTTNLSTGDTLDLSSVLSTAAGLTLRANVFYRENFELGDN